MEIKLGQKVRDRMSGMGGIAVGRTVWIYGCVRIAVQPDGLHDGVPLAMQHFDEPQLVVVQEEQAELPPEAGTAPAGPRPDATRAADPTRS